MRAAVIVLLLAAAAATVADEHAGVCPTLNSDAIGLCVEGCSSDDDCKAGDKCCSNGCGHTCQAAAPAPPCMAYVVCGGVECGTYAEYQDFQKIKTMIRCMMPAEDALKTAQTCSLQADNTCAWDAASSSSTATPAAKADDCASNPCKPTQSCVPLAIECFAAPCPTYQCVDEPETPVSEPPPQPSPCPLMGCPPPPAGCTSKPSFDADTGCQTSCGQLECENSASSSSSSASSSSSTATPVVNIDDCSSNPCKPGQGCVPLAVECMGCQRFQCVDPPQTPAEPLPPVSEPPSHCPLLGCPPPPAGCHTKPTFDANTGCQTTCGSVVCETDDSSSSSTATPVIKAEDCSSNPCKPSQSCVQLAIQCFAAPCQQYRCVDPPVPEPPRCPLLGCPPPPAGCTSKPTFDATTGCKTSCGQLECEVDSGSGSGSSSSSTSSSSGSTLDTSTVSYEGQQQPTSSQECPPPPDCPAPPEGCSYNQPQYDPQGCLTGCGPLTCPHSSAAPSLCPLLGCPPPPKDCTRVRDIDADTGCETSCGTLQCASSTVMFYFEVDFASVEVADVEAQVRQVLSGLRVTPSSIRIFEGSLVVEVVLASAAEVALVQSEIIAGTIALNVRGQTFAALPVVIFDGPSGSGGDGGDGGDDKAEAQVRWHDAYAATAVAGCVALVALVLFMAVRRRRARQLVVVQPAKKLAADDGYLLVSQNPYTVGTESSSLA